MEPIASIIRMLIDSSWRLGVPLAIAGAAVLALHKLELPEAGVLAGYIGWATLAVAAGLSFTVVSAIAGIGSAISRAMSIWKFSASELEEVKKRVSSLTAQEFVMLCELIQGGARRIKVSILSNGYELVEKGVLIPVAGTAGEPLCEVHPEVWKRKDELLAELPTVKARIYKAS